MRLGTRSSALALAQAAGVAEALGDAELVPVKTADGEVGDKSRFVRGVERAILDGDVELGVHSAKDLPGELHDGLALVGVPKREDPADAYIGAARSLSWSSARAAAHAGGHTTVLARCARVISNMGVSPDGLMALTRTPCVRRASAQLYVRAATPALVAQ